MEGRGKEGRREGGLLQQEWVKCLEVRGGCVLWSGDPEGDLLVDRISPEAGSTVY